MAGPKQEAINFLNRFCDLPYEHKIFICGNHDDCLYGANINVLPDNMHQLCNSGVEIDGVKFYSVPMLIGDCIIDRQNRNYANTPTGTDVLITPYPAYGIHDFDDNINYGSESLLNEISKINPRIHLFRHMHKQLGIITIGATIFSNGVIINEGILKISIS